MARSSISQPTFGSSKKNDLKHIFIFLWCMMWYLNIWMPIPKPKVSRFGRINTARLWREWEQAEAAEVGLVRGLQFRFERNWGEDRSIDVANELQFKLSATFFQRTVNYRFDWYDHQCNFFAGRWTSYMEFPPHLYLSKPHSRFPCAMVHSGSLAGSYLDLPRACFREPKWIASQVASDPGWNCWNLPMVYLYVIHI